MAFSALAAPMSQARCELETSALSKQEGVQRLCAALTQCVAREAEDTASANVLRDAAFTQTARLQQQVALLSKEKASLERTARDDALVSQENRELVRSVDALQLQVEDGRARASKAQAAAKAAGAAVSGAEEAAALARRSAREVVVLRKQLKEAAEEGVAADAQRAKLEKEVVREAGVAAAAVQNVRTAQAAAQKADAATASVESADAALVQRLAAAEAAVARLTKERGAAQAAAAAAVRQSAAAAATLRAQVKALAAERDAYRAQALGAAANCTRRVAQLRKTHQAELGRFERLLQGGA